MQKDDSRLPAFGVEVGVDVLSRVVVPVVRQLRSPVQSLSAVLKALSGRCASSSPLGERVIIAVVRRVYPYMIPPRTERGARVPCALVELWRREAWGAPGFSVLWRRVKTLWRGEVRRVCVSQQRRGGGEEVQGTR